MNEHVSKAVAKATGKCMALRKIRGVRPEQMRQMYMAAVVPTTDYAASTWYAPSRIGVQKACGRSRAGATPCLKANLAGVQVRGDVCPTE
jgi:hypothetical protein